MSWYRKLLIFSLACFLAKTGCEYVTEGFTVTAIDTDIPPFEKGDKEDGTQRRKGAKEDKESAIILKPRLNQKFRYLSRGGQSFVFVGEDGETILKLFKRNHPFSDTFVCSFNKLVPRPLWLQTRDDRFSSIFQSCQIANRYLREETGLLLVHLSPTEDEYPTVTLVSPSATQHPLDLDKTSFIVQRRVSLVFPKLTELFQAGELDQVRGSIRNLILLFKARCDKGIGDTDRGLKRNYGFLGSEAIALDIGSFIEDPRLKDRAYAQKDTAKRLHKLRKWLLKYHGEWVPYFDEELAKAFESEA